MAQSTGYRDVQALIAFLLMLGAIALIAWHVRSALSWILVLAVMALFVAVLGTLMTGRPLGILIGERLTMSLSRFQMVLWTLIVVSAYFVVAIARVKQGDVADPLTVQVDWTIWALLGISTTSLVASPVMASGKKLKKPADDNVVKLAGAPYGESEEKVKQQLTGVLYGNKEIAEARFTDMFEGEELVNASLIDVAKLQMFFFTVVIALAYCAELLHMIAADDLSADEISLPKIHEGLLTLMGISHAGYLGSKGVTQTPSAP